MNDTVAPLTVELLDHLDRPMAGFSGKDPARVSEAGTGRTVSWRSGRARLAAGKKFAIRVGFPVGSVARVYTVTVSA